MSHEVLTELRRELREIDRKLFEVIAKRQTLAGQIGRVKTHLSLPTRDYMQEKEVIQRSQRYAREFGLSLGLVERLMTELIRASLTVQERDHLVQHAKGSGRAALVIGGAGRMGRWFVQFLASQGFEVEVADPAGGVEGFPHRADWNTSDLDQDIVMVAAPLGETAVILREMAQRRPRGLVFDVGSLKGPLRESFTNLVEAGARVTSVHPMFGPDTELLSGRHVIFVDVGVPEATREAKALFEPTTAIQVEMDLESHDRVIAYVLGLSHALNIAFFTALSESRETVPRLAELSSTTFDAQLQIARGVAHDNPRLYFEIQALNDYGNESITALLKAVELQRSVVQSGNEDGFIALMERGREYLQGKGVSAAVDEAAG